MERSVRSGENATKSFLKAPKIQSLPATRSGRNTNSKPSRVIQTDGRRSSRPINRSFARTATGCWFAAMASPGEYPWTLHFVWKLLHNDPGTLSLLATNPFPDAPPYYIRARLYRYRFGPIGEKAWWKREPVGEWLPALSTDSPEFRRLLERMDWAD